MAPLLYRTLGMGKQLNEIVMAGSHDAAITRGGVNEKTQELDILPQARAGVRFFDIRINARLIPHPDKPGVDAAQLTAFHGPSVAQGLLTPKKTRFTTQGERTTTTNLRAGTWGLSLTKILRDAKAFVTRGHSASEFLILKFDKSTNYEWIATQCVNDLGDSIYSGGGNLNTKTLEELQGKVIVVFPPESRNEVGLPLRHSGILFWKNLYKPPSAYADNFQGLQYWGAGGTKLNNKGFEGKIRENIATQKDILNKAATGVADKTKTKGVGRKRTVVVTPGCAAADPNALGMMYWTTTGVNKSIRERDALMWRLAHRGGLTEIWDSGFSDYMWNALPPNVDMCSFSSGNMLKIFMPNIVMIDFADSDKCRHIRDLNFHAMTRLVEFAQEQYGLQRGGRQQ
jgi:hypothetical protein